MNFYELNLLPWREERRRDRQRSFIGLLGLTAIAAFLCVLLANWWFGQLISKQNQRNAFLQTEITKLEGQIEEIKNLESERQRLIDRKNVIEELQVNRTLMVHLFDQLARTVPEGLELDKVEQNGQNLTIRGMTQSNARVSSYLRNIESSDWLHAPELNIIEVEDDASPDLPYSFRLRARLASPEQIAQERFNQAESQEFIDES